MADLLGILCALGGAFIWGSGDFSGAIAARKNHPFAVLVLSSLSGIFILLICAIYWKESFPSWSGTFWALAAGLLGVLGLAAFYRALSLGHIATVAPLAAVIGAMIPVGFGFLTQGFPNALRLIGFAIALFGIWSVSKTSPAEHGISRQEILLSVWAGVSFGGFLILLAQIERGLIFTPLILTRSCGLITSLLLFKFYRLAWPKRSTIWTALLAGVCDASGNVFFLLAKQYTRLDVATVLISLYPAATVLLAWLVLKERISKHQWMGLLLCLLAVVLITL